MGQWAEHLALAMSLAVGLVVAGVCIHSALRPDSTPIARYLNALWGGDARRGHGARSWLLFVGIGCILAGVLSVGVFVATHTGR
jgi:hypothetical protein